MDARRGAAIVALLTLVAACGGSSSGGGTTVPQPPPFTSVTQVRVSQPPTYGACNGTAQPGTLYDNTAIEPSLVINPTNPANLIAEYQQGRWDNGGSQALNLSRRQSRAFRTNRLPDPLRRTLARRRERGTYRTGARTTPP